MSNNVAIIYQPHFMTSKFRVAVKDQKGQRENYIIVTCSPVYNGLWVYNTENINSYGIWKNKNLSCYEVPIEDCIKIKELNEIENAELIDKIVEQQSDWYNSSVKNRKYQYKKKPEWML